MAVHVRQKHRELMVALCLWTVLNEAPMNVLQP
jgi:hypothetical protein